MKTFTTYAEKKAKQFLNLLQGYTKGIRITAILILLLMGVSNVWAASTVQGGHIYFDELNSGYTGAGDMQFWVGHNSYSCSYSMSKIDNTKLWYCTAPNWSDATYFAFTSGANWGGANQKYYDRIGSNPWKSAIKEKYALDSSSKLFVFRVASTANKAAVISDSPYGYQGTSYTSLNKTITIKAKVSTDGGNSYNEASTPAKLTGSSKVFTSTSSCAGISGASATLNAGSSSTTFKAGYTANTTLTAVAATGYTFAGWYTDSKVSSELEPTVNPAGETTYYAYYKAHQYTVAFNANGGTGSMSNQSHTYGVSKALTANAFTKTGYNFAGWNTKADGTGTKYTDKQSVSNLSSTDGATVTLYAQWTINSHKVTWKANGGNWGGNTADKVVTYNYGATIDEQTAPTRDGYDFKAWSPAFVANTTMPDNDLTYTAQWTAKTYDVTLNPQSGTGGTTSVTATYDAEMPKITPPTRTGYTFNGYFDAQSGGTKYYKADGTSAQKWDKTSNTTLYAQWTINTYTITYGVVGEAHGTILLNRGDEVTTSASTTANYDTEHTFTAAPADGYKIAGWYSDANGANNIADGTSNTYLIASLTANTDVYVKFMEKAEVMYDVTVNATEGGTVNTIGTVPVGNKTPSTFTATPAPGYRFDEWTYTGGIRTSGSLTNSSIDITANGTGTLTAHFTRVHTVNFYATPAIAGSVAATVGGNTITSGDKLDTGRRITFTAAVANAYNGQCTFLRWVDGAGTVLSTSNPYTHTLDGDITVKAIFKINQYTLTFSAGDGGHVSATANNSAIASPATLDYNTSVTLTAEPDAGCAFEGWYEGGTKKSSDTSYPIILTANKTIEAQFTKGATVYMKAIEYWKKDHPRYAIYYWGAGDKNGWVDMTNVDCNGDIYEGYVPAGYSNFKFVRLAPSTSNDWANMWNETPDLTTTDNAGKMYIQPHVYLKPNSNWKQSNARFAAYFYADGKEAKWNSMNDLDGDGVYSCEIPTGYTSVIFCRMNPAHTDNRWNTGEDTEETKRVWNQTKDLTVPANNNINNLYTVKEGTWDKGDGTWSAGPHKNGWQDLSTPSYKITYSTPANGTITVTQAGNNVASGTSLKMGDEIKITFTPADGYELINYNVEYATETGEEGVYSVCGPTTITAEFAKAGTARTVYLRPNEDWLKDDPIFAAYAWNKKNDTQNHWYIMTTKADDYTGAYSCNISSTYDWVTFVRIKPKGRDNSDGTLDFKNAWNQTIDLQIMNNTPRFAIGEEKTVDDKQKYDGAWEENTPIWGLIANFNDWKAEKAIFMGYPGKLNTEPPFTPQHAFKLFNFFYAENSNYFGNAGTMKRANSGQWWTMDVNEQTNCQMKLDAKGDYIYQLRFLTVGTELRKQISVTYPEATNVYTLLYEYTVEEQHKTRMSYEIPAVAGEKLDTISFHVLKDASPKITLTKNSTAQGEAINIDVTSDSVYNFVLKQSEGSATIINAANPDVYTGNYYVRTDAATGGWNAYKQTGNKMTYSSYADKNQRFDHYFCKWVSNEDKDGNFVAHSNVKFCVANDYSHAISDELNGDDLIDNKDVATGCIPASANVRFAWDSQTNELSRAYISGSAAASDRFLVLEGNEHLKAVDGSALNVSGLNPNEAIFADRQNWIYQLDVQANPYTDISLTAKFNDKVQTFFGTAKGVMQATNENYHKVRMIYDFKTNNLVAAWLLDQNQTIEAETLASNILIIRENQGYANQITFANENKTVQVNTAYGVMTFTKTHIEDNSKSQRERSLYWISFPFDVKIDDVFGLGIGEYADQWIIQRYNGAARAEKGLFSDSGTYWEYIFDRNTVLNAGEGYVLVLDLNKINFLYGANDVSLYFPSLNNVNTLSGTLPTEFSVPEHWCNIDREWKEGEKTYNHKYTDSHWNLIGVPALIDQTWTEEKVKQYHFMQDDLSFYYNFNLANSKYTVQSTATTFKAMYAYMVQFAGKIDWSTQAVTAATAPAELAARHNSDSQPEKVVLHLELAQSEEVADHTFIQLQQEGATTDFDLSLDLSKIINAGSNIYTIVGEDRTPAAGNVLPYEAAVVPVGLEIATAGEYTFRMPDGTEGMVVELIDYETNTTTNLLLDDYTVNLPAGSNETRFALSLKPEKTATSIESTTTPSDSNIRKFIIDGKLYLQKDGMLYDAQGHIVR